MTATVISTTWGSIDVGALVVDAQGTHWRVHDKRVDLPRMAFLVAAGERAAWVEKTYDDEVVLVDESGGRAADMVMSVLDGTLLVEPLPTGPDRPAVRATYRAHLFHLHHLSISPTADKESGTLAELIEAHAIAHAAARPTGIPHEHSLEVR